MLAVLAVGACAGAGGAEWRGTAEPEVAGERVAWAPFEVAPPPVTTGEAGDGERARHGDADPCAGEVEPQLRFEHRGDRVPALQLALFAVRDPSRSAAVRALRVGLEREMAAALEPHWPRERVEDFRKSFDPAIAHTRWTAAHGCDPRRPIEMPDEAQEAAEAARLLQLERDLAAPQP